MRVNLTKPVSVDNGQTVVITCRLKRGQDFARLSVWSGAPGFELSPHVFAAQLMVKNEDGKPAMLKPLSVTLNEHKRKHRIEFVADEGLDFVVRQDIDVAGDPIAKAKVQVHGKASTAFRRVLRNAIRALRDCAPRRFRQA